MFTKTQAVIMQVFASSITRRFSIKEIADNLKKPYPLIHRSIQNLLKDKLIIKDEKGFLSLDYKKNNAQIAYIESIRAKNTLDRDKMLQFLIEDFCKELEPSFFILLIFGSYLEKTNPRDIDFLIIIEQEEKINDAEKILKRVASRVTKEIDLKVISTAMACEMLEKRDQINVMNETLNKHLILYGAESYYNILKNAR